MLQLGPARIDQMLDARKMLIVTHDCHRVCHRNDAISEVDNHCHPDHHHHRRRFQHQWNDLARDRESSLLVRHWFGVGVSVDLDD